MQLFALVISCFRVFACIGECAHSYSFVFALAGTIWFIVFRMYKDSDERDIRNEEGDGMLLRKVVDIGWISHPCTTPATTLKAH